MIDNNTKNKSFKEMRNILYDKGIDNPDFMLMLMDNSLRDIPEHPKDWNQDLRKRIVKECKNNFWFFAREIIRIPTASNIDYGDDYTYCNRFHLRMDTLKLFYAYVNNANIFYRTMNEQSINEAIAIMLIYEYTIRDDKRLNYDMYMPENIRNLVRDIITLNRNYFFLPIIGDMTICRTNRETFGLNKFIFEFINIINDPNDKYCMPAHNTIVCIDDLYDDCKDSKSMGILDKLLPLILRTSKKYDYLHILFNTTNFDNTDIVYIEPSYPTK